ncbi:MAG TPA: hypothetical protein VKT78_00255 [Fimbriimonadaceae bacterium]|nr:hypothetical protein [Fimbriimonadaceae bacterium]
MNTKSLGWIPIVATLLAGCSSNGGNAVANPDASTPKSGSGTTAPEPKSGGDAITIAYKPKLGATTTYDVKMEMLGGPPPGGLAVKMKVTPKDAGGGKINVESVTEGLPVVGNVTSIAMLGPDGKLIKVTTNGKEAPKGSEGVPGKGFLPDRPVKVGDTWGGTYSISGRPSGIECRLDKVESVGGTQLATIAIDKIDVPEFTLAEPGVAVVETATGLLRSMRMPVTMKFNQQPVTTVFTMERK